MSEKLLTRDFLSKENTAQLYKEITLVNEYSNLNKQQKDFIINNLIEIMKRIYKTLDFSKINNTNLLNIKKQYNTIVIKQTSELIKTNIGKIDNNQNLNNRSAERTFNSIKNPSINITSVDRPSSSIGGQNAIPPQMKVSEDFVKKTSGDIATRLAELENSRRTNNNTIPTDVPDFLKPVKVGREETFGISNPNYSMNNSSNNSSNHSSERKLEGFGDIQENFRDNGPNIDTSKYSDNMTLQDRLKKLEAERGMPVVNQFPSQQNQPQQSQPQYQPQQMMNQPSPQQYQPQQMMNQQQYQPQQMMNQLPSSQQYQPQPMMNQPPPSQQYQPQQMMNQPPPSQQYQPMMNQPPPSQQYQPQQMMNQIPPQNNQSDELFQQLNEMKMILKNLKDENNNLKHQIKNRPSIKTLQLDINKTTSIYKFQFNPINNILSLKLLSYNLPQPVYNIFDASNFVYEINDIQHQIIIPKGNYNIDMLLNTLNNNNDLIFSIDYTQKVSVKSKDDTSEFIIRPTFISLKIGFNMDDYLSSNKTAYKIFDLRLPSKLLLYIKNINQNPVCVLNFNNTSVCNLQFNTPLTLSSLDLEFYTEDNILYNFNDLAYNLSFALEIQSE
jgi:hypothetical protein